VEDLDANRRDSPGVLASRASLFQGSRATASLLRDSPANYRNGIPRKGRGPVDRERRMRNNAHVHASRTTRLSTRLAGLAFISKSGDETRAHAQ